MPESNVTMVFDKTTEAREGFDTEFRSYLVENQAGW